jgi:hypothetical protein
MPRSRRRRPSGDATVSPVRRTPLIAAAAATVLAAALPASAPAGRKAPEATAAAFTYIHCLNKAGRRYVRKRKPATCAHFGSGGTFGGGVFLKNIKWTKYSGREALGTATECGFHLPCQHVAVNIRAYRVRTARGKHVYTRLRAMSRYGTTVVRLATHPRAS